MEDQLMETEDCSYEIPDLTSMVQATDNCTASEDLVITQNPSSGTAQGVTYIEFTVTDASGNSSVSGVELIPIDNTAPVLDCPGLVFEYMEEGECETMVNVPGPIVIEECGTYTINNSVDGEETLSALFTEGVHEITWTVTDQNGNSSACIVELSVINPVQAAVICPDDISVIQNVEECGMFLEIEIPEVQGLCEYELTNDFTSTEDASALYGPGIHTVTYTAVGYVQATCSFEIEILDVIAPELNCPEAVSQCGTSVIIGLPSVVESCGLISFTNDFNGLDDASGIYPDGTTLVTWTATDVSGNVGTCSTSVAVSDPGQGISAGPDEVLEYAFNYTMQGEMPASATGMWTADSEDVVFSDPTNPNSLVNGLDLGENVLTWTVDNGVCGIFTDEVIIEVRQFLIPTGFSPNGDGVNDTYVIRGLENLGKTSMEVYDRWGKRIYQNGAYDNSWDGSARSGRILPTDTYFFIITIEETGAVIKSSMELKR
jgi:gliding motility-associated-like protein